MVGRVHYHFQKPRGFCRLRHKVHWFCKNTTGLDAEGVHFPVQRVSADPQASRCSGYIPVRYDDCMTYRTRFEMVKTPRLSKRRTDLTVRHCSVCQCLVIMQLFEEIVGEMGYVDLVPIAEDGHRRAEHVM